MNTFLLLCSHRAAPHAPLAHRAAAHALHMLFTRAAMTGPSSAVPGWGKDLCFHTAQAFISVSTTSSSAGRADAFQDRRSSVEAAMGWDSPWCLGKSFITFHFYSSLVEQEGRRKTVHVCLGLSKRHSLNQIKTAWVIEHLPFQVSITQGPDQKWDQTT